jgi:hypothetical protein
VAAEDIDAALTALGRPGFDPAKMAVIEGQLPAPLTPAVGTETVTFAAYGPSSSTIRANLTAPGLLVLADSYYPGWNAYVDGLPQPLYAANVAMRGVYVPAGAHTVEFKYEPLSFWGGALISTATLILLLLVVGGGLLRRNKKRKVQE